MSPDLSAYKTLGLKPGSDRAAVEAAYRRLIKRYHPDRQGGDAARAAEINRAYRHLREVQRRPAVPAGNAPAADTASKRSRATLPPGVKLGVGAGIVSLIVSLAVLDRSSGSFRGGGQPLQYEAGRPVPKASEASHFSEVPLNTDAIDRSVVTAATMAAAGDLGRIASQSRRCHSELWRNPALARLDQCVAFDEAVIVLMKEEAIAGSQQFSAASVTGRQLGATRLFTGDYLAMESRLDQIRSHVEFTLAPADPAPTRPRKSGSR